MRLSLPRLKMPRFPDLVSGVVVAALKGWVMGSRQKDNDSLIMYDRTLFWLTLGLAAVGFIMVTSASMPVGQRLANDPFLFAKRDGLYIIGVLSCADNLTSANGVLAATQYRDADRLDHHAADRAGGGEFRKRGIALDRLWSAAYSACRIYQTVPVLLRRTTVRKVDEVRNNLRGFLKPMGVILVLAVLLLAQPDLGTVVVLFVTTLAMLFWRGRNCGSSSPLSGWVFQQLSC